MAILHRAALNPTKMELLTQWLPDQPWFKAGESVNLQRVGAFRFDDPDGEVGIETLLVAVEGGVFQVPLTYRGSPMPCADAWLVGTMQHSVLGKRWIYDACADPVYAAALAATILTGQAQAEQFFEVDGSLEAIAGSVHVESSGPLEATLPAVCSAVTVTVDDVTTIKTGELDLAVFRVLNLEGWMRGTRTLTGTWEAQTSPVQLASVVPT